MSKFEQYSKDELVALLPFYLSEKLERDDRLAVDDWLANDPDALQVLDKISKERHGTAMAYEQIAVPKDGLSRLMADVAVTKQDVSLAGSKASLMGWVKSSILEPIQAAPSGLAWGVCGLLMLVTVSQSALLYKGTTNQTGSGFEIASGEKYEFLSQAVVKFKSVASMEAVASSLDEVGAVIVDGPTASGQFVIGFFERDGLPSLDKRYELLKGKSDLVSLLLVTNEKGGK